MDLPEIYQTFDDQKGSSPSKDKLPLLKIPEDLTGKYVLDIGCNEGFFSFECEKRGAMVTAIEKNEYWFGRAVERRMQYESSVDFHCVDWNEYLSQTKMKFDLVLFTAAFHYIQGNQEEILQKIHDCMKDDALLILEVGLADRYVREVRLSDNCTVEYPTLSLLNKWLTRSEFSKWRFVGEGVNMKGDTVKRLVYHVKK